MRALAAVLACGLSGGCGPVGPERLRRLRLSFWGFDGRPHVGTIVVHESVVTDVETVFRTLFRERFPIRQMQPVDAYGEAVDVNTVENPYLDGTAVLPPAGAAYRDRSRYRPGMAVPGGLLVAAFAAVGWKWGGRWPSSQDYQHFSRTGG